MSAALWLRRFVRVFLLAAVLLFAWSLLKGRPPADALAFSAGWALVSASIFVGTQLYHTWRAGALRPEARDGFEIIDPEQP